MKAVYEVTISTEEPPLWVVADDSRMALAEAEERASDLGITPDRELRATLQGEFPDWQDFVERYAPIANPFEAMAGCDSCLYAANGREWEAVHNTPTERVWTVIDAEDQWWITPGIHVVNRLGYFITRVPHGPDTPDYIYD